MTLKKKKGFPKAELCDTSFSITRLFLAVLKNYLSFGHGNPEGKISSMHRLVENTTAQTEHFYCF